MIFEIWSVNDIFEDGSMSQKYLNALAKAGFKLVKAKDELSDRIYKIYIKNLSDLRLLHKIVNHDLIILSPELKPTTKDTMSVMCDSDDDPKIVIYDDWIE